jgi:hypothetical protein
MRAIKARDYCLADDPDVVALVAGVPAAVADDAALLRSEAMPLVVDELAAAIALMAFIASPGFMLSLRTSHGQVDPTLRSGLRNLVTRLLKR